MKHKIQYCGKDVNFEKMTQEEIAAFVIKIIEYYEKRIKLLNDALKI